MTTTRRRFQATLRDSDALAAQMEFHGYSVTSLYEDVESELRKARRKGGPRVPLCRATIGHLRSGHRNRVPVQVAAIIEELVKVPRGSLFVPDVSRVPQDTLREAGSVSLYTTIFGLLFAAIVLVLASFFIAETAAVFAYLEELGAATGQAISRSLGGLL